MRRSFRKRARRIQRDEAFILDVVTILFTLPILLRYLSAELFLSLEWFSGNQVVRAGIGIVLVILAIIDFKRGLKRAGAFALIPVIVIIVELFWYVPLSANHMALSQEQSIRVMTLNTATEPLGNLANDIAADNIDVACLQEVYDLEVDEFLDRMKTLGYAGYYATLRDDAGMGTVLLSRLPVVRIDTITTSSWKERERRFLAAQINAYGQTVRVITVQLESTNRKQQLYGVIESWRLRLQQSRLLADAVRGSYHPLVIAGDLNSTPTNRSLKPLREVLKDSWQVAGAGLGGTWPVALPALRIDAILYRGFENAANTRVFRTAHSDHRAYRVDLLLPAK